MKENLLDGLKGLGKLLGVILWVTGILQYKCAMWLFNLQFSSEIKAELAAKEQLKMQCLAENIKPIKEVKKRAPRAKKVATEVVNKVE